MSELAIVVIAYNRDKSLQRLLKSIALAHFPSKDITLHISIDASENKSIYQVATDFEWKFGRKVIDLKTERLGLLKHVLSCGELTKQYDSIVVLEDDLIVAPGFYQYAQKANSYYSEEEKIAGVSLFAYPVEENNFYPFQPIRDDSDVHFIQVASSWGQSWTKTQWLNFKDWLHENALGKEQLLPTYVQKWGSNSWKKLFINYLIDTDRYFVFPTVSYSSNFEEKGTHASQTGLFQVSMNLSDSNPRLKKWNDSNSIYDAYFELIPSSIKRLIPEFEKVDFEVDIFGEKPIDKVKHEFLLTTRRGKLPIRTFGAQMKPLIQNVLFQIEGVEIGLYRKEDLLPTEENRFLSLNASAAQLTQGAKVHRQLSQRVTLVIPVLSNSLNALKKTVLAIENDRFYHCTFLLSCQDETRGEVEALIQHLPVSVEIISSSGSNLNELLRFGLLAVQTDYCGWMQAGMTVDLSKLEEVARIFREMTQVQMFHGIEEKVDETNYIRLNTSKYRWTAQSANLKKEEAARVRTEFVFWRKSLTSAETISNLSSASLFIELLKLNPMYVLALNLGSFNSINAHEVLSKEALAEILNSPLYRPKSGMRSIAGVFFRPWFYSNVPIFRLFYKEMEKFPMVIRYDFQHKNYYLDNY